MTDVVEPGTDVVPAEAEGGALVPADAEHPVAAEGHAHPGPRQYVLIAMVLGGLTGAVLAFVSGLAQTGADVVIPTDSSQILPGYFSRPTARSRSGSTWLEPRERPIWSESSTAKRPSA